MRSVSQAKNILRLLFGSDPLKAVVSRREMFAAIGKDERDPAATDALYVKLSTVRMHGFIENIYEVEHRRGRYIGGIRLTDQGRRALGADSEESSDKHVTVESVYADVKLLREAMPSFDIEFSVTVRESV